MSAFSVSDSSCMARALELAARGRYSARPNPLVGCVIARDGGVIGEGWHQRAGDDHAEINALRACGELAEGATAYVTLEPCAHHGKTPPCVDALIASKVQRVIAAMTDPFDAVAGRGLEQLAAAGVTSEVGLMEAAARALNEGFISRVTRGRPFVRAKVAASIDGATAMDSGQSQWITGPAAREDVQRLRAESGAVMTGVGTVLADDPSLTLRSERYLSVAEQPLRVVLDSSLQTPPSAAMLRRPGEAMICCCGGDDSTLVDAGAEVRVYAQRDGKVDVAAVLQHLAERQINDVLVEAGPILTGHMLQESLVDELVIYQSPHIMGGQTRRMFDTPSWTTLADRRSLEITDVRRVGADTRITARVKS